MPINIHNADPITIAMIIFKGASLGENKKSIGIQVMLQPRDHTLTDEEIEVVADKVVANVTKKTGGILRS